KLVEWIAGYTLTPLGSVLRLAMAVPTRWKPQRQVPYYVLGENDPPRMTPARAKVLDFMRDAPPLTKRDIAEMAGVTPSVIDGLVKAVAVMEAPRGQPSTPVVTGEKPTLRPDQAKAANVLTAKVQAGDATVTLLDGVTGSGKTETYMEAVAQAVQEGGQALILLPEIALTAQLLDRFAKRLGFQPEPWHSDRTPTKRRAAYQKIAKGEAPVVVGARSALFLPFPNLKLIVVDEEHETAFRQDDGTLYHGRDMAVVRGHLGTFPVVLASATPSLETVMNVAWGRYDKVVLEGRHGTAGLPDIRAIDMRHEGPDSGNFLSPGLIQAMVETLERGEQSLLYLNRRGFAPLTLCRACGHRFQCPHCTAWLVEHRFRRKLQCHHCGYQVPVPKQCPSCEAEDKLTPIGPGVERVAEEVTSFFPNARLGVLSSDFLLRDALKQQKQKGGQRPSLTTLAREKVAEFADGKLDILVGTQIVAKGHHFPGLTLVGVVDADMGLAGADPRAAERS
ncbi:MAG: replication restart helicase PriA, partial [Alphaproteobacteria bacterium]